MATIRPMREKWQAIIRRKGYPTITKSFDLKKDAEKWARSQERLIDTGTWIDRTEAERTTLGELLDRYQREVSITKRGYEVERIRINFLKRTKLAHYSLAAISGKQLAAWRDERLRSVSGSTVTRELQTLSHVFTIAIREWGFGLQTNPVSLIRKPKKGEPRDRVLTDSQRVALLRECGTCQNPWILPVVIFALETAARRGEILSLKWSAVNLENRTAKLNGKTGSRIIPLSMACVKMLVNLPEPHPELVFPVTIETLKQAYERAVSKRPANPG